MNDGNVHLPSLQKIHSSVIFSNRDDINLNYLVGIPEGVEFNNHGKVTIGGLEDIHPSVRFNNEGGIFINNDIWNHFFFRSWIGARLDGINSTMLLNLMIKQEIFI